MKVSHTRIFNPNGSIVSVPNGKLLDGEFEVGVTYSVTPTGVEPVPLSCSTLLPNRLITSPSGTVEHRTSNGPNISTSNTPFFIEFPDGDRTYVVPCDTRLDFWTSEHAEKLLPPVLRQFNIKK